MNYKVNFTYNLHVLYIIKGLPYDFSLVKSIIYIMQYDSLVFLSVKLKYDAANI